MVSDSYSYPEVKYFEFTDFYEKKKQALMQHKNAFGMEEIEGEFLAESRLEEGKNFERLKYMRV